MEPPGVSGHPAAVIEGFRVQPAFAVSPSSRGSREVACRNLRRRGLATSLLLHTPFLGETLLGNN